MQTGRSSEGNLVWNLHCFHCSFDDTETPLSSMKKSWISTRTWVRRYWKISCFHSLPYTMSTTTKIFTSSDTWINPDKRSRKITNGTLWWNTWCVWRLCSELEEETSSQTILPHMVVICFRRSLSRGCFYKFSVIFLNSATVSMRYSVPSRLQNYLRTFHTPQILVFLFQITQKNRDGYAKPVLISTWPESFQVFRGVSLSENVILVITELIRRNNSTTWASWLDLSLERSWLLLVGNYTFRP